MKYLALAFLFVGLSAFRSAPVDTDKAENLNNIQSKIDRFLESFESAVESHDSDQIMSHMDPDYVKEQHDNFLGGRTDQFINEFFGGYKKNTKEFKTVPYREIKKLKLLNLVHDGDNFYTVSYLVKAKGLKVTCEWSVKIRFNGGNTAFGMVGAVG